MQKIFYPKQHPGIMSKQLKEIQKILTAKADKNKIPFYEKMVPGEGVKNETSFGRVQREFARNLIVNRVKPERSEAAIRELV